MRKKNLRIGRANIKICGSPMRIGERVSHMFASRVCVFAARCRTPTYHCHHHRTTKASQTHAGCANPFYVGRGQVCERASW